VRGKTAHADKLDPQNRSCPLQRWAEFRHQKLSGHLEIAFWGSISGSWLECVRVLPHTHTQVITPRFSHQAMTCFFNSEMLWRPLLSQKPSNNGVYLRVFRCCRTFGMASISSQVSFSLLSSKNVTYIYLIREYIRHQRTLPTRVRKACY
jgi:hypothetical protein